MPLALIDRFNIKCELKERYFPDEMQDFNFKDMRSYETDHIYVLSGGSTYVIQIKKDFSTDKEINFIIDLTENEIDDNWFKNLHKCLKIYEDCKSEYLLYA